MDMTEGHLVSPPATLTPPSTIPKVVIPTPVSRLTVHLPNLDDASYQPSPQLIPTLTPKLPVHLIPNLDDASHQPPPNLVPTHTHIVPKQVTPHKSTTLHNQPILLRTRNKIPSDTHVPHPHIIPLDKDFPIPTILTAAAKSLEFFLSANPFVLSTTISIPVQDDHAILGLELFHHQDTDRIAFRMCLPSTPAA